MKNELYKKFEEKLPPSERLLFVIDLDGTTLSNSATSEMHPLTEKWIKEAVKKGHIVSIVTGRPWRSTQPIYEKLGLNTPVGNYNGAYVHYPNNDFFIPIIQYVNLNEMLYILGDTKVKESLNNVAFEGPGWVQLQKRDPVLEKIFGFDTAFKFKEGLDLNKLPLKPTGVICDTNSNVDVLKLKIYLDRKFGDLAEFNFWSKGDNSSYVFDISSVGVSKARVVSMLIRYYNVELKNIIGFGDAFNDVSMFRIAHTAIAMKNAEEVVKKSATLISKLTNSEGAVGFYIKEILNDPKKFIEHSDLIRKNKLCNIV